MNYDVLIVDDEKELAQSTSEYFNMFDIPSKAVFTAVEALEFFQGNSAKLILLDINLGEPGTMSGFDLCKRFRETMDVPILFISARSSDDDMVIALNIGGDDYITKPFTTNILLAKVKAVLARYEKAKENARLVAESFQKASPTSDEKIFIRDGVYLDTSMRNLTKNGRSEELRDMEYKLILYLLENAGRVITRDELLENVWGDEYTCDATITVHIRELRGKIEDDPKNPTVIKTVWGVGYVVEKVDE